MPDPGHLGRPVRKNPASPSIDRRVARTRHALQQAFLSLILSKGYEATTIDEICAVANVGRSTFYAHFTGKDDLKRSGLDHLRRTLQARQNGSPSRPDGSKGFGFSRPMFDHAREHLELYQALVGTRGGVLALDVIRDILKGAIQTELKARAGWAVDDIRREFALEFLVGAFMSVLTWWLDRGATPDAEQMDGMFQAVAERGLAGFA